MTDDPPEVRARRRVDEELSRTREKRQALDRFESAVRSVDAAEAADVRRTTAGTTATGQARSTGRRRVRRAFEEHVRPLSGDATEEPGTVHEAIATELSRDVAVALATSGSAGLPSRLKRAVLDESSRRRRELALTARVLGRERESLTDARDSLRGIREWLADHGDAQLSTREFDALAAWHRRLADHRETLDDVAVRRQRHLDRSTAADLTLALSHRTLAEYLYTGFTSTFPVLDACASLASACASAQRGVRDHLVGRA
jgi:hypothetical protein